MEGSDKAGRWYSHPKPGVGSRKTCGWILHNQLQVTLTHTPALPIHNERNYQELKREREKEIDTRTQPKARLRLKKSERERGSNLKNAHVIPECRNKL